MSFYLVLNLNGNLYYRGASFSECSAITKQMSELSEISSEDVTQPLLKNMLLSFKIAFLSISAIQMPSSSLAFIRLSHSMAALFAIIVVYCTAVSKDLLDP